MNVFTQVFEDTFQRPDEDPLNPAVYAVDDDSDPMAIVSHVCVIGAAAVADQNTGAAAFIGSVLSTDAYSETTISSATGSVLYLAFLRDNGTAETGYDCFFESSIPGTVNVEIDDPNGTPVASGAVAIALGDVLRFWCLGNTFGFDVNGVTQISGTSSTPAVGTTASILGFPDSGVQADLQFSRFAFGNVTSGGGGGGGGENKIPQVFGTIESDRITSSSTSVMGSGRRTGIIG